MIDYEYLVDSAMRVLIKDVLKTVHQKGLSNGHHFHVTFVTKYDGVQMPAYLIEKYPKEMTIALQNQFKNLNVYHDYFTVDLSFSNKETTLVIPFCAITAFADPSVEFVIRMQVDNIGMIGKGKFHDMISNTSMLHSTDNTTTMDDNVIFFAQIKNDS